jgi:HEAT repeat protein
MEKTKRIRIAAILLLFMVVTVVPCVYAHDARQEAWAVLNIGLTDKASSERALAVGVLGLLSDDRQAPELAMQALDDPTPEVRAAAADALGQLKYQTARLKIKEILHRNEEDPVIVIACARALLELGDEDGYAVYYAILTGERKSGSSLTERQKKEIKDPKKMAEMGSSLIPIPFAGLGYGAFTAFTRDDASPAQAAAAKMLIKDPDPKTKVALINASRHKSWTVRVAAVDSLAHRDDPSVIPELEPRLSDDKDVVRYTAAAAIIRLTELQNSSADPRHRAAATTLK